MSNDDFKKISHSTINYQITLILRKYFLCVFLYFFNLSTGKSRRNDLWKFHLVICDVFRYDRAMTNNFLETCFVFICKQTFLIFIVIYIINESSLFCDKQDRFFSNFKNITFLEFFFEAISIFFTPVKTTFLRPLQNDTKKLCVLLVFHVFYFINFIKASNIFST